MSKRTYRPGDFLRVCDRTGFTVYASDTRREWTGAIVRSKSWESRHPQDFVKGRRDRQSVPDPRPRGTDVLIGPLVTELSAAAAAGATNLTVLSSARMAANDTLGIVLDNGDLFRVVMLSADTATTIQLNSGLPGAASSGNAVFDYDAVSPVNL